MLSGTPQFRGVSVFRLLPAQHPSSYNSQQHGSVGAVLLPHLQSTLRSISLFLVEYYHLITRPCYTLSRTTTHIVAPAHSPSTAINRRDAQGKRFAPFSAAPSSPEATRNQELTMLFCRSPLSCSTATTRSSSPNISPSKPAPNSPMKSLNRVISIKSTQVRNFYPNSWAKTSAA